MSDYTVLFTESGHNLKAEKDSIKSTLERRIDGIIFIGDNSDIPLIQSIAAQSIPIVTGDRTVGNIPSVTFTNRETVQKWLTHFINRVAENLCMSAKLRQVKAIF